MTRDKWAGMSSKDQKIKIAELCGWLEIRPAADNEVEEGECGLFLLFGEFSDIPGTRFKIPNYLFDLNAMYDVPQAVFTTQKQWSTYCDWLLELAGENTGGAFEATAQQRAEAFVLTMEPEAR